jgi:uncharacterized membrane protein
MAGIGFELRKLLRHDSLLGTLQAYAYAGVISSGPWVLSILAILLIGVMAVPVLANARLVTQFQVTVLYLLATSLVLTGCVQLAFTRFTADRLYEKKPELVLPNFNGLLLGVTLVAAALAAGATTFLFTQESGVYRLLVAEGFVILCNIWIATIFLSGMKEYKAILVFFAAGYGATMLLAYMLMDFGLEGLLAGFVLGQGVLLLGMVILVARHYPSKETLRFDFLKPRHLYPSLVAVGLLYNLGIWMDKLMFWYWPATSQPVIGPLRASVIYDMPVFLAYLSIIPGMAVFLVKMETDFVEYYDRFFDAVRRGASLTHIEDMRNEMVYTVRQALYQIMKVQTLSALLVIMFSDRLLAALGISGLYQPLLLVNVIAAGLQVVFLGILNVFFYLDKRRVVLGLTAALVLLNGVFTAATFAIGPTAYGFGFALALLVVVMAGFWLLDRKLEVLEYETFMLQ